MLCANCSQVVKPVVAVDVDGTLGDYHGHFLRFAADYFGWDRYDEEYDGRYPFKEWWCVSHGRYEKDWHDVKLAYRQGGMKRTMPIFQGAQALCWAIKDAGAELWITTTRPYLSLDNIVPDTVEWCRRHEIEYDGMLFDELKYQEFSKRIDPRRVVAVFDDLPEMYDAAQELGMYPWLVKGKYNRAVSRPGMCDLDAAADVAVHVIHQWRELHDERVAQ